jgi:hypothetical protein
MSGRQPTIADLAGTPMRIVAGGEAHEFHPLTVADMGDLQAWVDGQFPDPFDVARRQIARGDMPQAQQRYILELAMNAAVRAPHLIGTPEADALISSADGLVYMLYLGVRKAEPDFTVEDARAFAEKMNAADAAATRDKSGIDLVSDATPPKATAGKRTPRRPAAAAADSTGAASTMD